MASLFERTFVNNFGLKLVALLLAVGLWFVVARDPIAEVEMRVPIELHNVAENLEVDARNFTEAQIRIRGPERVIHRLQPGDVWVRVDVSSVRPGERTFDLSARQAHVPQDLEVVQISPSQFQLSFDTRATRMVKVRPRVIGTFASGMRVADAIADPASVTISGPRRRIEAVESATTDPVDASGTLTRASFSTHPYVPDAQIQVVHPTPIRVTVIMGRLGEEKKME
jgi:YbbR domain-containing protein